MCGIAGIFTPGQRVDPDVLAEMVAALEHRGPDGEGSWVGGDIALGMRRLAIVDIAGGDQPVVSEDGSIRAVFNGEIYNHLELRRWLEERGHRMNSEMDGEVICHLYEELGERFAERLEGIFAIGVWDERRRRLLLIRDHFGVKPLYFHAAGGSVRFASELRSLLRDPSVPRRLDLRALDEHLTFRFTPSPHTLLEAVEKVEPAGCVVFSEDSPPCRFHYWEAASAERDDLSFDEAAEHFLGLLRAAVRRQMMSDRPIGAMLSGGIDSAAVVALMAEAGGQVRTFTIGFEGGGDADETGLARETADLFATEHHDLIVPSGDFRDDLAAVIEELEEPVATSSAIGFRQVSRLARDYVPVLLSGQGADEILGGYWRYVGEWIAARTLRLVGPTGMRRPLAALGRRTRSARLERGLRALRYPDPLERFMQIYAVFDPEAKDGLYSSELRDSLATVPSSPADAVERLRSRVAARDPLAQMMYVDTRLWLPDDFLLVGDKMSMSESVEMRVPFLDRELVEFTESLPSDFKVHRGRRKLVEKRALAPLLPRRIVHRKERGFITPIDRWLRGPELGDWAREVLLDPGNTCSGLFQRAEIERLLERHRTGAGDQTRQLFTLLSFELWSGRYLAAG